MDCQPIKDAGRSMDIGLVRTGWRACAGYLAILFGGWLLSSCSSSSQMPPDTQLRIYPTEKTIRVSPLITSAGSCVQELDYYQDVPIQLVLEAPDSQPVGDAIIQVYADYSGNTSATLEVMSLYQDVNQNGVIDAQDRKVSTSEDGVLQVRSDRWHGNATVLLRVDLSCPFRGYVTAYAGAAAVSMPVSVIAEMDTFSEQPSADGRAR